MTPTTILTEVVIRTGRTDIVAGTITAPLTYILNDITRRYPFLRGSKTLTYTISPVPLYQYDCATVTGQRFRAMESIGDTNGIPLERIVNNDDWIYRHTNGEISGEPYEFYVRNDIVAGVSVPQLFINPVPDQAYTHVLSFSYLHPTDVATILLDDEFFDCVVEGVCWRVWASKGQGNTSGTENREAYETELSKLSRNIPSESIKIQYHDV